jgi:hypothetical protein
VTISQGRLPATEGQCRPAGPVSRDTVHRVNVFPARRSDKQARVCRHPQQYGPQITAENGCNTWQYFSRYYSVNVCVE